MNATRTLRLRSEVLTELADEDLRSVVGGTATQFTCQLPRCQGEVTLFTICC